VSIPPLLGDFDRSRRGDFHASAGLEAATGRSRGFLRLGAVLPGLGFHQAFFGMHVRGRRLHLHMGLPEM